MGVIARIKDSFRREKSGDLFDELKIMTGSTALKTASLFSDAGEDSTPLNSDYAIAVPIPEEGGLVVVGFIDPKNAGVTAQGEKRIYSRDGSGVIKCSLFLKGDGSAVLNNGLGSLELESSGDFVVNGVRITTAGDVISATGVSLNNHQHTQGNDSNGDVEVPTNAPTPTP